VSSSIWAVLVILATIAWFALPLIPGFHELIRRTDVAPLRVPGGGADIRFFANSYRRQIEQRLPDLRALRQDDAPIVHGLDDGTHLRYLPPSASSVSLLDGGADVSAVTSSAIVSESSLTVPSIGQPLKEVYTTGDLEGAPGNVYRALLVDGHIRLGANSVVARWVDAGGDLTVPVGSTLWGRASAGGTIRLATGVAFQRVAAPCVVFGEDAPATDAGIGADSAERAKRAPLLEPPEDAHVSAGRWLIHGDLTVPAGTRVDSAVVVSGTLRLERGACVTGAAKATVIRAEDRCLFLGALVASDCVRLGAHCQVDGPIVAERDVEIGERCRLGDSHHPTTVTALDIRVQRGVVLSGEAWARHSGVVEAPNAPRT
jgi:cytoskeletal protein CcmA (bactofilin family)